MLALPLTSLLKALPKDRRGVQPLSRRSLRPPYWNTKTHANHLWWRWMLQLDATNGLLLVQTNPQWMKSWHGRAGIDGSKTGTGRVATLAGGGYVSSSRTIKSWNISDCQMTQPTPVLWALSFAQFQFTLQAPRIPKRMPCLITTRQLLMPHTWTS